MSGDKFETDSQEGHGNNSDQLQLLDLLDDQQSLDLMNAALRLAADSRAFLDLYVRTVPGAGQEIGEFKRQLREVGRHQKIAHHEQRKALRRKIRRRRLHERKIEEKLKEVNCRLDKLGATWKKE